MFVGLTVAYKAHFYEWRLVDQYVARSRNSLSSRSPNRASAFRSLGVPLRQFPPRAKAAPHFPNDPRDLHPVKRPKEAANHVLTDRLVLRVESLVRHCVSDNRLGRHRFRGSLTYRLPTSPRYLAVGEQARPALGWPNRTNGLRIHVRVEQSDRRVDMREVRSFLTSVFLKVRDDAGDLGPLGDQTVDNRGMRHDGRIATIQPGSM